MGAGFRVCNGAACVRACVWITPLSYAGPHATNSGCGCLERRLERPTVEVRYGFNKVRRNIKDCELVEETVDPYGVKVLATSTKTAPVSPFSSQFPVKTVTKTVI
jgi:hypothetical protein